MAKGTKTKTKLLSNIKSSDLQLLMRMIILFVFLGSIFMLGLWISRNPWFLSPIAAFVGVLIGASWRDKEFRDRLKAKAKAFFKYFLTSSKKEIKEEHGQRDSDSTTGS